MTYTVPTLSVTGTPPGCPDSTDGSITMTAGSGRAPLTYSLISPSPVAAGTSTTPVDVANLSKGVYFIVYTGDEKVRMAKIIVE